MSYPKKVDKDFFNNNICSRKQCWINQEKNICYWRDCSRFEFIKEKFSLTWMKENIGIQAKNIPQKNCDERKTWWNGIIANNK